MDAAVLTESMPLFLLTPVEVVRAVLPEWTERGDGAFLLTTGVTAVHPVPQLSGLAPAGAAARNYLHSLHDELADSGIYAGTLSVAAGIARSELIASMAGDADATAFPLVDPDELADQYWEMYTRRDRIEVVYPSRRQCEAGLKDC